jgi:2-phosphosulfolactate phosphatase
MALEVLFTPADFAALRERDLGGSVCVVLDVLRATSSMVTALYHGAEALIPVIEIAEAVALRRQSPALLLAGERQGLLIDSAQTGEAPFDFGNSPREFTRERVAGRTIAITTTNGTRALRACRGARRVLVGSFLNLGSTVSSVCGEKGLHLLVICSGTFEEAAYEDVLAAGALCDAVWPGETNGVADSSLMARELYRQAAADVPGALCRARNGRKLLSNPNLREDVAFCARRDAMPLAVEMLPDGRVVAAR